jgi:D-alanyl-D-alanine carboxypeptidase
VTALATGALLAPATHAAQLEFGSLPTPDGVDLDLGYGLGIMRFLGFVGHNGAIFGYSPVAFRDPATGATVVIEGNKATNFSSETLDLFFRLGSYLFPKRFHQAG